MDYWRFNGLAVTVFVCVFLAGCSGSEPQPDKRADIADIDGGADPLTPAGEEGGSDDVAAGIAAIRKSERVTGSRSAAKSDEKVTIAMYTGPTIYLPSPPDNPEPTVADEQTIKKNYDDGTLKKEQHVRIMSDNTIVSHGDYAEYYANGKPFVKGKFVSGVQEGVWHYWYENGTECKVVTYKKGVPDGSWEVYRDDGTRQFAREFTDGKKNGTWRLFAEDGEEVLAEENYDRGKPEGVWTLWRASGQKHTEFNYKDGKKHGAVREWDENDKLIKEYAFVDGNRHGISTTWLPDGGKIVQEFRDGKLIAAPDAEK